MKKQIGILVFTMLSLIAPAQTLKNFSSFIETEAQKNNELARELQLNEAQVTPNQELYDVYFYSLDFEVFPEIERIKGKVMIYAHALSALDSLELNYSSRHEVQGIYLAEYPDSALDFQHYSGMIDIKLDKTYSEGEDVKILVEFASRPIDWALHFKEYQGSDMIFNWISQEWFPCKKTPGDKADSTDMRVTLPRELVVASNGLLKEVSNTDTSSTYYWQERYPIAPYLMSFAAYPYEIHTDWYVRENNDSMMIQMFTIPEVYEQVQDLYAKEKQMLAYFEYYFGPYPFFQEKYGHNEAAHSNSEEFQTMTGFSKDAVQDEFGEYTIAHELAHSWMGNSVTNQSWHHVWIQEGFATYAGYYWWDYNYHEEFDLDSIMALAEYYGSGTPYVENPVTQNIYDNNLSYLKPAWVYHMLRHMVGESVFFDIIKAITSDPECAYGNITTDKFREIAEHVSGMKLEKFFQQWIMGEYYPDYAYSWTSSETATGYELELTVQQVQDWQLFWMPVDVAIETSSGVESFVIWDSLETQVFQFELENVPLSVMLDPDNWVLNKASDITGTENNRAYEAKISVYPNPTHSFITIETITSDMFCIEITSLNGKLLFYGDMEGPTLQIDLSSFQKGVYFITIKSKNFITTKKIIKL